jgi:hypothetical protein
LHDKDSEDILFGVHAQVSHVLVNAML